MKRSDSIKGMYALKAHIMAEDVLDDAAVAAEDVDVLEPLLRQLVTATNHRGDIQCKSCGFPISSSDQCIKVSGRHDHQCVNPLGYAFHIGCFGEAFGCAISGDAVSADIWFPSFRWQFASCSRCSKHLGWYFQDAAVGYFYGLILSRVTGVLSE